MPRIHLACVDLYPLADAIAKEGATRESVVEMTDIGGPTMLRSATKGRRIVICDPQDRSVVIDWLKKGRPDAADFLNDMASKAEAYIAEYCLLSANYHSQGKYGGAIGRRVALCKYGENAWQTPAALYSDGSKDPLALDKCEVVAGTAPSYNNWCDIDRMLQTMTHLASSFTHPVVAAIAVKHGNPCGASVDELPPPIAGYTDELMARMLKQMIDGDKRAIFGGLVMTNFSIDGQRAEILLTHGMSGGRRLLDGIVAPSFTQEALDMLKRKGDKCRFIVNPALSHTGIKNLDVALRIRNVRGGFLLQPNYTAIPDFEGMGRSHDIDGTDLRLAWAIGSTSNSNTITLVKDGMLIGNGVGQQDRVGCCELAIKRARDAGHSTQGAVAYSDSFFPFPDGPQVLIDAGVRAILTSFGSVNDDKVRDVCKKHEIRLYMIPDAEARGFYGH